MALWDGRFGEKPDAEMIAFGESLSVDLAMLDEDVQGSKAHATMLGEVGLLTAADVATLHAGLDAVRTEIATRAWVPGPEHEDVHMAVEARLTEKVGPVGGRLHTARSRNDQVATDSRLWLKHRLPDLIASVRGLVGVLLDRVDTDGDVLIPGFTHLQRGQPILLGHHLLAHTWAFVRDAGRLEDALRRLDECPLGACAMAGTPHPIDRNRTSELLGFARPVPNAMDAVSARDHAIEVASACAILCTNLSRVAEELVLWSTEEFALVRMADGYATGSSIMPQKRNPDAAELVRGRCARVIGDLQTLLVLVKGLPMAYDRDLQEDRRAMFDAVDVTTACVRVTAGTLRTLTVNRQRYEADLRGGFLLATELADWLVTKGLPFRDAHHASGRVVARCEALGIGLDRLPLSEYQQIHAAFDEGVFTWLDPRAAAERRTSLGGTATVRIREQVATLRARLAGSPLQA